MTNYTTETYQTKRDILNFQLKRVNFFRNNFLI